MINQVSISFRARKQLKKLPCFIVELLAAWIDDVENRGLGEVRKTIGYNDEKLYGKRIGQRSIRLNRSYRAIYQISKANGTVVIIILEVNKHEY